MDKKYQVFISSTYKDMKAERQAAVEAILDAGHIPAGMELFAASDKAQLEVIKSWIDKSDIFMLILGGRYGAIEPESGKSYTHLEYEHAISTGKPFFALYMTDEALNNKVMSAGKDVLEQNDTKAFNEFRETVTSKNCREIEDVKDIKIQVPKSIGHLAETRALEGWVRASEAPDVSPLLVQLQALQEENAALKVAVDSAKHEDSDVIRMPHGNFSEESLNANMELVFTARRSGALTTERRTWHGTYLQMFILLAGKLIEDPSETVMHEYVNRVMGDHNQSADLYRVVVSENDYQNMKMKFAALGLIALKKVDGDVRWMLSDEGKALMMRHHAGK
ncbi:DUF4062 domain-containing protein [Paraburkholderia sp. J12]|uniref:DUF4062 domain-containing protein n=1 Tax=Paraburkholderia sp. J12 TaxID=2805432 RepID=UPI002ABD2700|nr:DUF4062 domain-containing protein [Paraburkholderia sp. J12]